MKYRVVHGPTASGPWTIMPDVTARVLTITGLENGTPRFFKVRALSEVTGLLGGWSETISRTPVSSASPPASPANFQGVPGDTIVALSWDAVSE